MSLCGCMFVSEQVGEWRWLEGAHIRAAKMPTIYSPFAHHNHYHYHRFCFKVFSALTRSPAHTTYLHAYYTYHLDLIWLGPLPHLTSLECECECESRVNRFTFFKKIHDDERVSGTSSENTRAYTYKAHECYMHTEDTKGNRFARNCCTNLSY